MLKEQANQILARLEENGFEAYFVGGCVRDWLLGRPVHDIDICTNAHPRDVMRLFPEHIPTGLQHGTVTVKQGDALFEVTTFRVEGNYRDFRRPDEVQFVSDLTEDLQRRDFTINAIAMDRAGTLFDPFHGLADLRQRIIRAVGEPKQRFAEDALRLLRAARFAAQLGFEIEPLTYEAMKQSADFLPRIAVERMRDELNKLLNGAFPQQGFRIIGETGLLRGYAEWGLPKLFASAETQAWRLVHLTTLPEKWSLLFYAAGSRQRQTAELTHFLRMSNKEQAEIGRLAALLLRVAPEWDRPESVKWAPLLLNVGRQRCLQLASLLMACWHAAQPTDLHTEVDAAYQQLPVKTLQDLTVSGKDLQLHLQKKPGDWIGRVLQALLVQVALHGLANRPETLLAAAKKEVERDAYQTKNT
ncbi:CCA tRNA nucleotidyltransferase [Brevibacillus fulvus]|uniref:tRNA nucleotidyltransferase (CCA-adding enzyme) n=1 Tax=Brevibacillus fulvus TaxID=1125967 RepID=A0A938Y080_9BACL|nr:CCA tRNA nucleotidyltransferase [Brevibacillus fulvus]MBM7588745.1 tRNA nucleotidyltransferase (CCA-adding enzyme) [Brevibacillus fulvus]